MKFAGQCQCFCCRPSPTCALIEFRALRKPGGRERAMAEYHEALRHRYAVLSGEYSKKPEQAREPGDDSEAA